MDCDNVIGPAEPNIDECIDFTSTTTITELPTTTTSMLPMVSILIFMLSIGSRINDLLICWQVRVIMVSYNAITGRVLEESSIIYVVKYPDGNHVNGSGVTDNIGQLEIGMHPIGSIVEAEATKESYLKATTNIKVIENEETSMKIALALPPVNWDKSSYHIVKMTFPHFFRMMDQIGLCLLGEPIPRTWIYTWWNTNQMTTCMMSVTSIGATSFVMLTKALTWTLTI